MLRSTKWGRAAAAGLSMLVLALAGGTADAADKVSLRLGWTYGGMFAPIYLGIDKGFFSERASILMFGKARGRFPRRPVLPTARTISAISTWLRQRG